MVVRFGAEFVERRADLCRCVTAFGQPRREQIFLDVAVAAVVSPIADIAVVQLVAEEGDDPVLPSRVQADRWNSCGCNLGQHLGLHVPLKLFDGRREAPKTCLTGDGNGLVAFVQQHDYRFG